MIKIVKFFAGTCVVIGFTVAIMSMVLQDLTGFLFGLSSIVSSILLYSLAFIMTHIQLNSKILARLYSDTNQTEDERSSDEKAAFIKDVKSVLGQ